MERQPSLTLDPENGNGRRQSTGRGSRGDLAVEESDRTFGVGGDPVVVGDHDDRTCPECREALRPIGEELSERLEYVPASLHVIQDVRWKYACPKGCPVVTAAKPMQPIEKGLPGPGLPAHVAVSKYADHQPLYRQEEMLARQGVSLSRRTMAGWMGQAAELLSPLYEM